MRDISKHTGFDFSKYPSPLDALADGLAFAREELAKAEAAGEQREAASWRKHVKNTERLLRQYGREP